MKFQYVYDKNDNLIEIRDLKSGEKNSHVLKKKGKIYDSSIVGQIQLENGNYQDRFFEYTFDERDNIVYQKDKHNPVEVIRDFNRKNLLTRETYLYQSRPLVSIEYRYDISGRLIMKSLDNGIRYYYFRDKDGQVMHKIIKNMLTGEEIDGVNYSPHFADFDQDGFELIKYKDSEKLFIRDAEGNIRYMVEIFDVLRFNMSHHQRTVHSDGDPAQEIEYAISEILERKKNPNLKVLRFFDLLRDIFDFPLENPAESGEGMFQIQSAEDGDVGCYQYGWCAPQYSYCVDCFPGGGGGGGGEDPGGGGGSSSDCNADINGPLELDIYEVGYYNLITNCQDPHYFIWYGGYGLSSGGTSYSTYWDTEGLKTVRVTFQIITTYIVGPPDDNGNPTHETIVTVKEASKNVYVQGDPPPPEEFCIEIVAVNTPSNGSFIANRYRYRDEIEVTGRATKGTQDISHQIMWTCFDNPYDSIYSGTGLPYSGTGAIFMFTPDPPSAKTGRTAPLSYLITAQITVEGTTYEAMRIITQDKLDELRQEYEDLPGRDSQDRGNFDQDPAAFPRLLDPPDVEYGRHNWHILRSLNQHALVANCEYVEQYCGGDSRFSINFISGYRCPVGNSNTLGAAPNSNHQYGRAFDFDQGANTLENSWENYNAYLAADGAGAAADTYLRASDGSIYHWRSNPPPPPDQLPPGVIYIQGHGAWDN